MKKVLIGILSLIPIIIMFVVVMVTNIVALQAHIPVEDIYLRIKGSDAPATDISLSLAQVRQKAMYLTDFIDIAVYPARANNYTLEYKISGDTIYTDIDYEDNRKSYIVKRSSLVKQLEDEVASNNFSSQQHYDAFIIARGKFLDSSQIVDEMADLLLAKVKPAASFVNDKDEEVELNSTGRMLIVSYCKFTVKIVAENVSKTLNVSVVGDDVERVLLSSKEDNSITVGHSVRLFASYTPIDSIVEQTIWQSSDENVASVDQNGVVTAVGEGKATISVKASVNSSRATGNTQYVDGMYELTVEKAGASSKFGNSLVTSKSTLILSEIGITKEEIKHVDGATINDDETLVMTENKAVLTAHDGQQLTIESCFEGDIIIKNAAFFKKENGYVLSVGENVLKLQAVWVDQLKTDMPQNVVWSSSDTDVATVDKDGNVRGVSNGFVTITAEKDAQTISIELEVRQKLASIQLSTSDASLAIGVAQETVFASEKYIDVKQNNDKTPNSTFIVVQGEPQDDALLQKFYSAYVFEIVSGEKYASFDNEIANKLIFNSALEGAGKQEIVVRVSAKYPKYEDMTRFTTEKVTIKAVFGVECSNIDEARQATKDQKEYARSPQNVLARQKTFEKTVEGVKYAVYNAPESRNLYAICLANNIAYEIGDDGTPVTVDGTNNLQLYGDLYGNNRIISAVKQQVSTHLIRINWSGVTLSNTVLRANSIGDDGLITDAKDTEGFTSTICEVIAGSDWDTNRLDGICIEYCIFENAKQAITFFNTNATLNGCIIRNMTQVGMYIPQRMAEREDATYPFYSHLNMHNIVCSNMLGSLMSVAYEKFTMKSSKLGRFVDDFNENERIFLEEFYRDGINCIVNQTGFLEAYNWQDIKNAGLLKTGSADIDNMIGSLVFDLVRENSAFDNYKYTYNNETYMHVAFICSGVYFKEGILNSPTYLQYSNQGADYSCIDTSSIKPEGSSTAMFAANIISKMSLKVYGYTNDASITPGSTYQVNSALIARIHS